MKLQLDSQKELHGVTLDVNEVILLSKVFKSTWMGDINLALSGEEQAQLSALRRQMSIAENQLNTAGVGVSDREKWATAGQE